MPAGFPSPADDHVDRVLSLHELVGADAASTYFARVEGDSMTGAGIHDGDVLVVDRSAEAADGAVVVASLDGELLVKRLVRAGRRLFLASEDPCSPPVEVGDSQELVLWGVVTFVVHDVRARQSADRLRLVRARD